MGLVIRGYVLEPPRVGQSNSPFTFTPNVIVDNQGAFDAAYPSTEVNPRTEYHAFVLEDGHFDEATFCWTKNETLARFDYDGAGQRFKTLPGAPPELLGTLGPDSNTTRLIAPPPASSNFASFPLRLSVGVGSGTPFTVNLVANSGAFGLPGAGNVELAQNSGELNWNPTDLTNFAGQIVRFQRQAFYSFKESSGNIGLVDDILLLNPKPATGQFPLIRIGYGFFLTPIQRATEGLFSVNPAAGTVEWALDTGRLKFNSGDVATYTGKSVFYDGVVFGFRISVPVSNQGTVNSPVNVVPVPSPDSDVYFRIPNVVQFQETEHVDAFSVFGKLGVVELNKSTGGLSFSLFDRAAYGTQTVQMVLPDLPIERGMSIRWFRTPVDLTATDPSVKDVASLYPMTDAILADPIVQAPQVLLPTRPVESMPITIKIEQGTGSFTGTLPNLDVPNPPPGLGYIIDFEKQQLSFAQRREDIVVPGSPRKPYGAAQLPDPLVFPSNLVVELETAPGSGTFAPLTLGTDVVMDYAAGVAKLVTTVGLALATGSAASSSGSVLTDTTVDFLVAGVAPGDFLVVPSGSAEGVYTITAVGATTLTVDDNLGALPSLQYVVRSGKEVLADRYFREIPPVDPNTRVEKINLLGPAANSPRLTIPNDRVSVSRLRFGKTTFVELTPVVNDAAFTAPGALAAGTVQVSEDTGNLNFATADLGTDIFWSRTLELGADFRLQPALGFVEFTERLLEKEEVHITYAVLDDTDVKQVIQERGAFLVRKEVTQDHPAPTNTLFFNPLGREVASTPAPAAFRGGRPQKPNQVTFDVATSSMKFQASKQVTNALPAGEVIAPNERVYVDYYVYEAIGGEKDVTVLQPPMLGVLIVIEEGTTSFRIAGDRTTEFPVGHLLRVDGVEVYLLAAPSYDPVTDLTTVNIASPQVFASDLNNPALAVTSGQIRVNTVAFFLSYFVTEMATFESVPRGSNTVRLVGDLSRVYAPGTVLLWTNGGSILDFNLVDGAKFNPDTNRTELVLKSNGRRQYTSGAIPLRRSVRPILESATAGFSTSRTPELQLPFEVFRRIEGETGEILVQPDDYSIDESGRISLAEPLRANEEVSIFYTGATVIEDGRDFRASYTHLVVPSDANGLVNQILRVDYTAYSPDTLYWRVETMTTFRGELAVKYGKDAQSSIPTGGPRLENASTPKLYEQGRESVFYGEGRYANEDIVARKTLKFLHDGITYLEDALQGMDGRVVGDHDGRFRFDGNTNNPPRATYDDITNDIDDLLKVKEGPPIITFPPFSVTFEGTYQEAYKPSKFSRFYPTRRRLYSVAAGPAGLETGDTILDTGVKPFAQVGGVQRRIPWAVVTKLARAGETTVQVDAAQGAEDLLRPAFDTAYDLQVSIQTRDGTLLVNDLAPLTVTGTSPTSLTFLTPLPVDVPVGSTIRHIFMYFPNPAPADPYLKMYRPGFDIGVTLEDGTLTHVQPFPPFDGSVPGVIPDELCIQNPAAGEILDVFAEMSNAVTEPVRFPALDGSTRDDDNNRQFPILNPSPDSELGAFGLGALSQEQSTIEVGGTLRTATTTPFIGTGDLDGSGAIITNTGGAWPAPIPKVGDLVRITSGVNGVTTYRRIASVGGSTITVVAGHEFTTDTGFSFTITVSNSLATGTTGQVVTPTLLVDPIADFVAANVQPGHTIVFLTGANAGLRRQVTGVSATTLSFAAVPSSAIVDIDYRVDNPLNTYGGTGSLIDDVLVPALDAQIAVLRTNVPPDPRNQLDALEMFFDHFFTDIVTSATGATTNGSAVFTDASANFGAVNESHYIFIRNGSAAGVYKVLSVDSATQVTIDGTFPATAAGVTYRIVKVDFLTKKSLEDSFQVLLDTEAAVASTTSFQATLAAAVAGVVVMGDAGAYANSLTIADLDTRLTAVNARVAQITDPVSGGPVVLSAVMATGDRLYDKRYVWIDARVNLEKGILPLRERSIAARIKARKEVTKQLTKILTVKL